MHPTASAGVAGGSIAAVVQSLIGNVAKGSLFALLTSLGATGAFTMGPLGIVVLGVGAGKYRKYQQKCSFSVLYCIYHKRILCKRCNNDCEMSIQVLLRLFMW